MIEESLNLLHYRCRAIYNVKPGYPIVFLHGYMFTSDVWRDIGLLDRLEEEDIPFIAIDMPYGRRSVCSPKTSDPDTNVRIVYEAVHGVFGSIKPLLVGASLGGYIALKYSTLHPVLGLALIAPVHSLEDELLKHYRSFDKPVLLIYGSRDEIVSREEIDRLHSLLKNSRLKIYQEAKHPAYLDQPQRFIEDIIEFYRETTR